ncbi:TonB-dependent siderophore receptor [Tardiphaga robiniae]|uniref:Ligand-gated channel n=1 Tax=Tardiphaga robiniae TaxID=943830 RepID=A0A163XSJ3_9BRAD|nr:TonB-dependent siderophore receptor [Tardiphaga robiniae]KZD21305.1 ligand-gated channel [Tardiphaga robiniae]
MGCNRQSIVWAAFAAATLGILPAEAQPAPRDASVALPPVTVQQPPNRSARRAAVRPRVAPLATARRAAPAAQRPTRSVSNPTNTSDRYLDKTSGTATKTDTPVLETPQSISTITRRQIDDQNAQTVGNALRYTAGVLSDADTNSRYDSIFMRGFGSFGLTTSYVSYFDGLKLPRGQAFAVAAIDPFLLDRIDVLKGPSAMLYGQSNPGGLVNQVSRMPSATPFNEFRVEGGSYGRIQSGVTSQGALDKEGHWLYSLSAIGRSSGTRYGGVDEQRVAVAPSLTWAPDMDTRFTIQSYYQNDPKGGYFNSIYAKSLAPAQYQPYLNSKLNVGDPGFDSFRREQYGVGYQLEKRLTDVVSLQSSMRYSHVDIDFQSLQMNAPLTATGQLPRWAIRSTENVNGLSADNRLQFDVATGALQHKIITGVDYQETRSNWRYEIGGATALDVVNPIYYQPVGAFATFINNGQNLSQAGLYAQDQISLGGWRATLGIRHDWADQSTENRIASSRSNQADDKTTYRAGLLYLFDNGVAPYVSYSTSFEPVAGVDVNNSPFVPTTGEQYEAGVKYQPTFLPILLTAAVFDIRQQNVQSPAAVAGFFVQQGEVRSTGAEFEVRGNFTDSLELVGALTFLDTRVTKSTDALLLGMRPQAVPDFYGSAWANYTFRTGPVTGLTLGGGVRHVGSTFGDDYNTLRTPAYTVADLALKYELGNLTRSLKGMSLTLNVNNLFDKEYYSSCSSGFYCQYANRRTVLAGMRYRW